MFKKKSDLDIYTQSKVLFIYPHPDDETFASAALIQRLVQSEITFRIVCLTRGSSSTLKFGVKNKDLAEVRMNEFIEVMEFLRVSNFNILDFLDGNLENDDNLLMEIEKHIIDYSPTHLVTYEPSGIYGHPDHIIVSKIITELQSKYNYTILYSTVSSKFKPSKDSLSMAKKPSEIKPLKSNVCLSLSFAEFIIKLKALRIYKSQVSMKHNFFHNFMHLMYLRKEHYNIKRGSKLI